MYTHTHTCTGQGLRTRALRVMKEQRLDVSFRALTPREDLPVGAVEGQAEDVGQVFSLQLHRLGPGVDGFLHVP